MGAWVDRKYHTGKPDATEKTIEGGVIDETGKEETVEWALQPEPLTKERLRYLMRLMEKLQKLSGMTEQDLAIQPNETALEWEWRIDLLWKEYQNQKTLASGNRRREMARLRQAALRERRKTGTVLPPYGTGSNNSISHGPGCKCEDCRYKLFDDRVPAEY